MRIVEQFLTNGAARPSTNIIPKGVVLHWVANPRTTARENRNYFQNQISDKRQNWASAHYCVDEVEIIRCIPENEMAYHVGATKYKQGVLDKFDTDYPNDCLIGIELCHIDWDGNFDPRTWANAVELVTDICRRYQWGVDRIIRHFDVTGKDCPRLMVNKPEVFERFKADVAKRLNRIPYDHAKTLANALHQMGVVASPETWEKVFRREVEAKPEWIQGLAENVVKKFASAK